MTSNQITFKPLCEDDLVLLHQWFQVPHVKEWYARGVTFSLEMIREKYLPRLSDPSIPNFIISYLGKPVGYIQFYHVTDHLPEGVENYSHSLFGDFKANELVGIDLFFVDENILGKGICSKIFTSFVDSHIKGKFRGMVVDPVTSNSRAIVFFERNGFKRLTSSVDVNHLLMLSENLE